MLRPACLFKNGVHGDHAGHPVDDLVTDQQFLHTLFTALSSFKGDLDDGWFHKPLFG